MGRYLFIAALAFVGGYAVGLSDAMTISEQVMAMTIERASSY